MSGASESPMNPREAEVTKDQEQFARALALLDAKLDWDLLAEEHGATPQEGFFAEAQRDALVDSGLRFATDLAERLEPGGRSLYVGAAIAEWVPMLFEALILKREVCWLNLAGAECDEYQRAIALVSAEMNLALPLPRTWALQDLPETDRFDHLWLVSVLTDPAAFPGLHDALYGRGGGAESADPQGLADLAEERSRAIALVGDALDRLGPANALITSTDEEWPLLLEVLSVQPKKCELEQHARLSGLVGDPVRFGRLGVCST